MNPGQQNGGVAVGVGVGMLTSLAGPGNLSWGRPAWPEADIQPSGYRGRGAEVLCCPVKGAVPGKSAHSLATLSPEVPASIPLLYQ